MLFGSVTYQPNHPFDNARKYNGKRTMGNAVKLTRKF